MVKIYPYLQAKLVVFLDVTSRDEVIDRMVEAIYEAGQVSDKEVFRHAILEREKIVSTGIGMGVAIPHAKLTGYENFFIAIGILPKDKSVEGIDWHALDGTPVRLIFMIGGPDDKQTEYLQLLSSLTIAIKDEERRKALLTEKSAEKIIDLFKV